MRTVTLVLIALAMAALPADAIATPNRGESQRCGDIPSVIVSDVVATQISCRAARTIARRYVNRMGCYQQGCSVGDYRCHMSYLGYESYHARCVNGGRVAGFDYGA